MGRKPLNRTGRTYDIITEACPGARTRFRLEIIPELICWLGIQQRHHQEAEQRILKSKSVYSPETFAGLLEFHRTAASVIGQLMSMASEKWSRYEWCEAIAETERAVASMLRPDDNQEPPAPPPAV